MTIKGRQRVRCCWQDFRSYLLLVRRMVRTNRVRSPPNKKGLSVRKKQRNCELAVLDLVKYHDGSGKSGNSSKVATKAEADRVASLHMETLNDCQIVSMWIGANRKSSWIDRCLLAAHMVCRWVFVAREPNMTFLTFLSQETAIGSKDIRIAESAFKKHVVVLSQNESTRHFSSGKSVAFNTLKNQLSTVRKMHDVISALYPEQKPDDRVQQMRTKMRLASTRKAFDDACRVLSNLVLHMQSDGTPEDEELTRDRKTKYKT